MRFRVRTGRRFMLATALCTIAATGAGSALAQVEEIVVTAQKREQGLQDVPISVSAVTGDALQAQNLGEMEAISAQLPNIHISESAIGDKLFIRGIGSGVNAGFEQSVATFVDGVYYGRSLQTRSQFLDIARIEVLRGPQSTYFGNNSIAGALNITTRQPSAGFNGYVNTFYEFEHNERHVEGAIGGALSDTLSARIAGLASGVDGWVTNLNTGQDEGAERNRALRASLLFEPGNVFDALLKVEGGTFDVRGRNLQTLHCPSSTPPAGTCAVTATPVLAAFGAGFATPLFPDFDDRFDTRTQYNGPVPARYTAAVNSLGAAEAGLPVPPPDAVLSARDVGDLENTNATLTLNWHLEKHTLTAVSGFSKYGFDFRQPTDFVPLPLAGARQLEAFEQFSQELRLVSGAGNIVDYMLGAYWQTNELTVDEDIFLYLAPPYAQPAATFFTDACREPARANDPACRLPATIARVDSDHAQQEESWAGFASLTWHLHDTLRMTVGARYTQVDKSIRRRQLIEDRAPGVTVPCIAPVIAFMACTLGAPLLVTSASPPRGPAFGWQQGSLALARRDRDFTPSVNLQWELHDDTMLYASYSEGFKAGGFDQRNLALSVVTGQFAPESVSAVEVGMKSRLLDNRLMLNLALFRGDYDDLQVSTFDGVVNFLVNNAGSARTQGIESELRWAPGDSLVLGAAVAVLDAKWKDYADAQCTALDLARAPNAKCAVSASTGLLVQDLSGADLLMAPHWSGNVSLEHYLPLRGGFEVQTQLLVYFEDDKYLAADNDPATLQERFAKVNLRIALAADSGWELAFIGRNLTNELTSPHIEDLPLRSTNSFFALTDRPRTFALQGQYRF
jgi:iron complex outermembrane receptor protein